MIVILIAVLTEETEARKRKVILLKKNTGKKTQKVVAIISLMKREYGSVGFEWCLIRNITWVILDVVSSFGTAIRMTLITKHIGHDALPICMCPI